MKNINEIMDMLDWNNDIVIQEKGRRLASEVKCLKIFMQPCDKQYNKNVWENCALIICKHKDEILQPYLFDLLNWLQDLNWPGTHVILDRLKKFKNYTMLAFAICESVKIAQATDNDLWLYGMSELLVQEKLLEYLDTKARSILEGYRGNQNYESIK